MSDTLTQSVRPLPADPDLRHLKDQARDLVRSRAARTLAEALFRVARLYGYPSWPKLKSYVESLGLAGTLKAAIDANDLPAVRRLMTRYPDLHRARIGYRDNGPLTWVAECRVPRVAPSPTRLAMAAWMIENGSDVHQGGDGPLMRAALDGERIPMMELLLRYGADVNARSLSADGRGPTPLFHAVVTSGGRDNAMAQMLLDHGAEPNARADLRKQFRHMGDPEREKMHEYHNVTALGYARRFQEPDMVSAAAVTLLAESGGAE